MHPNMWPMHSDAPCCISFYRGLSIYIDATCAYTIIFSPTIFFFALSLTCIIRLSARGLHPMLYTIQWVKKRVFLFRRVCSVQYRCYMWYCMYIHIFINAYNANCALWKWCLDHALIYVDFLHGLVLMDMLSFSVERCVLYQNKKKNDHIIYTMIV